MPENPKDINHHPSIEEILKETIFARGEIKYFVHPLNIFKYIGRFLIWIIPNKTVAIVMTALLIPVYILALIIELTLSVIDTLIFDPIRFVAEEVKQHYDYRAKEFLYLPAIVHKLNLTNY